MVAIIVAAIVLFILVFILSAYFKSSKYRGKCGEKKVRRIIGKTIDGEQYVINDLTLKHGEMTSQIDHIVINRKGVFVIETKNRGGEIYGTEQQREWTQVLSYGRTKNTFYNPVKQNATHIYNVRQIIGNLPVHSLVVFVQNNVQHIDSEHVIPLSKLKYALAFGNDVLSSTQMENAYMKLLSQRAEVSNKEHIRNIRKQQLDIEKGICPRCGGKLVLRNGKYGEFWGCSNYPKCTFKKRTDE